MSDPQTLLDRFLQYVQVDTQADDNSHSVPSTSGQLELGKILAQQLVAMGVENAKQDDKGVVIGNLASNADSPADVATLVFNAHIDTSPEASGKSVKPNVITYPGGDIDVGNNVRITVAETPALNELVGKTLITTDGSTLLGGDDKAGVAIIMQLAKFLCENPEFPRPNVTFLFTCDEEIGRGPASVDVPGLEGTVAYTFDGGGQGVIDSATFSADMVVLEFRGTNIHPAIAKDRMVNSIRAAGDFLSRLPDDLAPECTDGVDGFVHPFVMDGSVAATRLKILLRSFQEEELRQQESLLRDLAAQTGKRFPKVEIDFQVVRQYRNMAEALAREPRALELAVQAHRNLELEPELESIRGGTDGSQFSEKGLPTPNLSSGQHNLHCEREFACLEQMETAVEIGKQLVLLWSREKPGTTGDATTDS